MWRRSALALLAIISLGGCTLGHASSLAKPPPKLSGSAAAADNVPRRAGSCAATIASRPLPVWARGGFHPPTMPMPYVMGDRGYIVAILWADPLHSPPLRNRNNKILWVSRRPSETGAPLRILARLDGTGRYVHREVGGGPGPSIINLPSTGCWSLHLIWSGHQDHISLRYIA